MKEITPGDDYAMMQAMIRRRFARLLKETCAGAEPDDSAAPKKDKEIGGVDFSKAEQDKFSEWPDLVLIDGGGAQLEAAQKALEELGLKGEVAIAGIAKGVDRDAGREQFFLPGKAPFRLDEKNPVLYYLQRLRDESHRFAIGAHREKRKSDITKNPLDEIEGVGPSRKKALLARFGSARSVGRAAVAELEEVPGINTELARRIHDFFRSP
jgi:excinuclease ABC subunit C